VYRLVEAHYEEVKAQWEERFESRYGHWRGFVDGVVMRYLDCGRFEAGFGGAWCPACHAELLARSARGDSPPPAVGRRCCRSGVATNLARPADTHPRCRGGW